MCQDGQRVGNLAQQARHSEQQVRHLNPHDDDACLQPQRGVTPRLPSNRSTPRVRCAVGERGRGVSCSAEFGLSFNASGFLNDGIALVGNGRLSTQRLSFLHEVPEVLGDSLSHTHSFSATLISGVVPRTHRKISGAELGDVIATCSLSQVVAVKK